MYRYIKVGQNSSFKGVKIFTKRYTQERIYYKTINSQ